jgi:hypothetical protein
VARAIVEGDRTWQQFSPFALVWAGAGLGRAAKMAFGWSAAVNQRAAGILARRREVRRLEAEAKAAKIKQFAGLAAAAAAPPEGSRGPIHPRLQEVARPIEPEVETIAPALPEPQEDVSPAAEPSPIVALEALISERAAMVPVPETPAEVPAAEVAPPVKPKRTRGPKKKKSATARTTLAAMSRDMLEKQAVPPEDRPGPANAAAPVTSVDKKV